MNEHLLALSPSLIWKHFKLLCDTPRPSYHEAPLRSHLIDWAQSLGMETYLDPAGNLLIRKSASQGMENRQTVVLQGHLDMVAQKNAETQHDFEKDPIQTQIIDGWVHATGTTLGADNGIGVAAALAVLESTNIPHGPIEALFTIEEETSLRGAMELEEGILKGKILLNLDSEDRGDVYIGCAGGTDINFKKSFSVSSSNIGSAAFKLAVKGLKGGHSGLDIHKGLANANVLLVTLLQQLNDQFQIQLMSFNGGTLRNAIAREATASFIVNDLQVTALMSKLSLLSAELTAQYEVTEKHLQISLDPCDVAAGLNPEDQANLLNALDCSPHGVFRMSAELAGVTETSCNLGVIDLTFKEDHFVFSGCSLVRSLIDSATDALARKVKAAFALIGAEVAIEHGYPGWRPDPKAGLLKHFLEVHKSVMGYSASVKVIHAGLECGIIGSKYQGMEMVSFGPNIRGAHSPTERLEIDSVEDFWRLLVALLVSVPIENE
ncbi:aminoacyl-histidine dipeptidase [Marinomonas sp. 15G1-11]|uniref:Aminoacyl-histidine dipeptidase n=1 Tax=Marinomonas phaeophyticola TaxID=3004091 RepID=A0ABT4JZB7_9GAMM|nr:aminoacyl-histidine dipeptidase [Marinomonas sp. 15G1-11]MCZ2723437.1 aminoacyl-histidine dipeptidase [Marinomonas sp. 15G1-11]